MIRMMLAAAIVAASVPAFAGEAGGRIITTKSGDLGGLSERRCLVGPCSSGVRRVQSMPSNLQIQRVRVQPGF